MSLRYLIDGYNFVNHPLFSRGHKRREDIPSAVAEFIRAKGLCGSRKNKITVVFDGYPPAGNWEYADIEVIFSCDEEADERIRKMLEKSAHPKSIVVVSNDNQVIMSAKLAGAQPLKIEEFVNSKKQNPLPAGPELNYTQMHAITEEFKKIWLK